jgi:hypothetical protein
VANLTEQQAEAVANRVAKKTVEELLQKLGMDTEDVREQQKDFAHLRQQRQAAEQVAAWSKRILLGIVISSLVGTLVAGLKAGLNLKG